MSLFNFQGLPTELQLQVVGLLPARSVVEILQASRHLNLLASSSLSSDVNDLTTESRSIFISIFSPQNKNRLVETFNTICVSNPSSQLPTPTLAKTLQNTQVDMDQVSDKLSSLQPAGQRQPYENRPLLFQTSPQQPQNNHSTLFQLGDLEYTRDPLRMDENEIHKLATPEKASCLHLMVNEDEPHIKLQLAMQLMGNNGLQSLFKFYSRLNQLPSQGAVSGVLASENNAISVHYTLTKGDEVPPQSGYDYDLFYNYEVQFGEIEVKNGYLMDCVENSTPL